MDAHNEKGQLPNAIDLSHHLSRLSKARQTSPLKGLARYWGKPGLISLAGGVQQADTSFSFVAHSITLAYDVGMPSPAYFPFAEIGGENLVPDSFASSPTDQSSSGSLSWLWRLFSSGTAKKVRTEHLSVPKYAAEPGDVSLEVALQYGTATGLVPLQQFMKNFVTKVYQPAYANFTTLVHAGNTDGYDLSNPTAVKLHLRTIQTRICHFLQLLQSHEHLHEPRRTLHHRRMDLPISARYSESFRRLPGGDSHGWRRHAK